MKTIRHEVQFCVVGGGIAGMCAAMAAARHGVETLLMHERPVLGGNASSEIRMWICGSKELETGIVEELRLENLYRNTYPNFSVWDSVLYEKVRFQEHLTLLLNCSCIDAKMKDDRLASVKGWQMTTQSFHEVEAELFADCSGDSILAPLSGADFRIGREAKAEFGETLAQDAPDNKTMGLSCLLQARETDRPQKFIPPAWAYDYPTDDSFPKRGHSLPNNFWWLELGGDRDSIGDSEEVRDDLLKTAFGIWDHIKNHGDHHAENWVLDWVGFLPGKRESRRYMGDHILTETEILSNTHFDDMVAYGGWPVDDHHPDGFNYFGPPNTVYFPLQSYGIPMRSLYSRNVPNLLFAGRNISASHVALSSSRVMGTCATLGQAVGTAAFYAVKNSLSPRETTERYIRDIQQALMNDDCYLPGLTRRISALSAAAELTVSNNGDASTLRNGHDRSCPDAVNAWICGKTDSATYRFKQPETLKAAHIVFDSNLNREEYHNMPCAFPKDVLYFAPPETLVKAFHIEADGKEIFRETNNYQRLVNIPLHGTYSTVKLVIDELRTEKSAKIFSWEVE